MGICQTGCQECGGPAPGVPLWRFDHAKVDICITCLKRALGNLSALGGPAPRATTITDSTENLGETARALGELIATYSRNAALQEGRADRLQKQVAELFETNKSMAEGNLQLRERIAALDDRINAAIAAGHPIA